MHVDEAELPANLGGLDPGLGAQEAGIGATSQRTANRISYQLGPLVSCPQSYNSDVSSQFLYTVLSWRCPVGAYQTILRAVLVTGPRLPIIGP